MWQSCLETCRQENANTRHSKYPDEQANQTHSRALGTTNSASDGKRTANNPRELGSCETETHNVLGRNRYYCLAVVCELARPAAAFQIISQTLAESEETTSSQKRHRQNRTKQQNWCPTAGYGLKTSVHFTLNGCSTEQSLQRKKFRTWRYHVHVQAYPYTMSLAF